MNKCPLKGVILKTTFGAANEEDVNIDFDFAYSKSYNIKGKFQEKRTRENNKNTK